VHSKIAAGLKSRGRTKMNGDDEHWRYIAQILVRSGEALEVFLEELVASKLTERQVVHLSDVLSRISTRKVNWVPLQSP
jgi:hypothetical protein